MILWMVSEAINSSAPSNLRPGARFVWTASHPCGGRTGFENQLQRTQATAIAIRIRGLPKRTSPGATMTAIRPAKPFRGKELLPRRLETPNR
jgi:hypothetical protein